MNANIIKNYRSQNDLRHSFNELAGKTFDGLNFEAWYQNGYWGDRYNPHSIVVNDKVIANVSVNFIDFMWNGQLKHFIQLGTVMTEESFRNQGLIRRIMNEIDQQYGQTVDGFYLFASDSVLDFYPKFGFRKAKEYCYTKPFSTSQKCSVTQVPMQNKEDWNKLTSAMEQSILYSRFAMINNDNLIMFYITGFMHENVYYDHKHDAYVIAEIEDHTLFVYNIFSQKECPPDDIYASFGSDIHKIALGFTPLDNTGYTISEFREEDCTLFIKGEAFDVFEQDQLIFPTLSHA